MPPRLATPLVAVCLALAALPVATFAFEPEPRNVGTECVPGQNGPAGPTDQFIDVEGIEYYTLIDPTSCGCAGRYHPNVAHMGTYWPSGSYLYCIVWIVGADGAPGCWVPNRNNVLCGPSLREFVGSAGQLQDATLQLPLDCCIEGPAFLKILFLVGSPGPKLQTDTSPDACVSYSFRTGEPASHDLIAELGYPGNPVAWVEGDCCLDVPIGTLVAPEVIQAGPDGTFMYEWLYVVANPIKLNGYGADNIENTSVQFIADAFCEHTTEPGYVFRSVVDGYLLDRTQPGRVSNWISICSGGSPGPTQRETLIQPYLPTGAKPSSWGKLKVRYR
jgi:hypothetical protein